MDDTLQLKIITALQDKLSGPLKKISGSSKQSAKSLKDLRDKLKGLEAAQKDIGAFRELTAGLKTTQGSLQAAQTKVAALATALKATENPTKQLRTQFNSAVSAAQKLSAQSKAQAQELQHLRSQLSGAGVSTRTLSTHERTLRADIQRTSEALKQQTDRLRATAEQQSRLAKSKERFDAGQHLAGSMAASGAAGYFSGRRVLSGMTGLIAPGIEFDEKMSNVQALSRTDKKSQELAALRQQARDLGASTMFSATQVADAQGFFAMAGFNPQAIEKSVSSTLDLAKAGKVDLGAAADISSNILSGFNLSAEQMGRVNDVLTLTFTSANTNLSKLGDTMKYVAPIAASVGVSIEEVAAMAGKLGDDGIQGSMAGTALRSIYNRLSAPPKAAREALEELKIKAKDMKGNLRPVSDLLVEIFDKTKKLGTADRAGLLKDIAGEEAVAGLQTLVKYAGSGELQQLTKKIEASAGGAARAAKVMADNITGDLDELSSAYEDLGISVFEGQNSALRDLVTQLTGVVNGVGSWIKANPGLTGTIVQVAAVLGGLLTVLGAIAIAMAAILGPFAMAGYGFGLFAAMMGKGIGLCSGLAVAIKWVSTAIFAMSKALLANPVGVILTAIAVAAFLIWQNWDWLKSKFGELWTFITNAFTMGTNWITSTTIETWGKLSAGVSGFWTDAKNAFSTGFIALTHAISTWDAVGTFRTVFAAIFGFYSSKIADFAGFGRNMIQGLIDGIKSMAGQAQKAIEGVGSDVVGWFKDKLGIRSPSRVFMQLGGFVSQGMAIGIERQQSVAMKAASAMAASVIAAGSMSPASAHPAGMAGLKPLRVDQRAPLMRSTRSNAISPATANTPIEIHIHAGTQSPMEIARAVRVELERIQSAKASRQRAQYTDYGA